MTMGGTWRCAGLLALTVLTACQSQVNLTSAERDALGRQAPALLPAAPPDPSNRYADDPRAQALGQRLFFETRFSGQLLDGDDDGGEHTLGRRGDTGKVSCAGCHVPADAFVDSRTLGRQISLAAGWGRRHAPSLYDVGQAGVIMWDGRHDALYNQPFGPIESPVEYNSSRLFAARELWLGYRQAYEDLFGAMPDFTNTARFPVLDAATTGCKPASTDIQPVCDGTRHGMPGDGAEYDGMAPADQDAVTRVVVNLGKAIGAYERRLTCGPGRVDAWMHGDASALNAQEQLGAKLFAGKANCSSCHSGPFGSDQKFHNVGLRPAVVAVVFLDSNDRGAATGLAAAVADPVNTAGPYSDGDDGRLAVASAAGLEGAFRTPTLRCVGKRKTFMHTGQLASLDDVVRFFSRGGDPSGYPGQNELQPLGLTAEEQAALVAFLNALDGPGPDPALEVAP